MIRVAGNWLEELEALRNQTLAKARTRGRSEFISEDWNIEGLRVRFWLTMRNSKCGRVRYTGWVCEGRRVGFNDLCGKLRRASGADS